MTCRFTVVGTDGQHVSGRAPLTRASPAEDDASGRPKDLRAALHTDERNQLTDSLAHLTEGARRGSEVSRTALTLPPGVPDRLKRLAEHVEAEVRAIQHIAQRNA